MTKITWKSLEQAIYQDKWIKQWTHILLTNTDELPVKQEITINKLRDWYYHHIHLIITHNPKYQHLAEINLETQLATNNPLKIQQYALQLLKQYQQQEIHLPPNINPKTLQIKFKMTHQ
jgi:plasmid rolling circle replication initiator protein Rep